MKHKDLNLFLNRKASSLWESKEKYLKGWGMLQSTKNELSIHLHLIPESLASIFLDFCKKHTFQPTHIYTTSALAPMLIAMFDENTAGLNCVAASSGNFTYLVIGTKQVPFLIRELPISWEHGDDLSIERINREIQRTILFSKQQYNQSITKIDLIGKNASNASVKMSFQNITEVCPVDTPVSWITFAFKTSPKQTENLLPKNHLGQLERKRLVIALSSVVLVYLAMSIASYILLLNTLSHVNVDIAYAEIENEINRLMSTKSQIEQQIAQSNQHIKTERYIKTETKVPLPGWFAGYTADMLPDGLILKLLSVQYDSSRSSWAIAIEGLGPRDPLKSAELLETFQKTLTRNTSLLTIDSPWRLRWIENLHTGGTHESDASLKSFRITGVIH
jgi:hypothetical protein